MADRDARGVARLLGGGGDADADLIARYRDDNDQAAFAQLVRRHARLVRAAAARVLADPADVDDAAQATFLVLVRRLPTLDARSGVGPWLYGVAHRVAVRLRGRNRRQCPSLGAAEPADCGRHSDPSWREACDLLHAELDRLPDRYRLPLLLCYLEGRTRDEAAAALGVTTGTVKGRVRRGVETLRRRLARRGVTLSAGLAPVVAAPDPIFATPDPAAAVLGAPSARASELAQELIMGPTSWKWVAGIVAALVVGGGGAMVAAVGDPAALPPTPPAGGGPAPLPAGAPAPEKPDPRGPVKEVVTEFYRNLAAGKAKENEGLFTGAEAAVSGIDQGNGASGPKAWRKTTAEYLKGHGDQPKYLQVDSIEVDMIHPGMAAVRVNYRAGGVKGYVVLALLAEKKRWRIASLFEETHFVW